MDSDKSNLWMMAICCGLPLILIIFGAGSLGGGKWVVFAFLAVAVLGYMAMRSREKKDEVREAEWSDKSQSHEKKN
ncbi:MAG TPA: hypothetical protein VFQ72_01025 [Candidatus Paceibacterota bacterium]|nr:hypothetical protein [Candidatus Paceibacterota bacterium]